MSQKQLETKGSKKEIQKENEELKSQLKEAKYAYDSLIEAVGVHLDHTAANDDGKLPSWYLDLVIEMAAHIATADCFSPWTIVEDAIPVAENCRSCGAIFDLTEIGQYYCPTCRRSTQA